MKNNGTISDATNVSEKKSLMKHHMFDIVDEKLAKKPITTQWVFEFKKKNITRRASTTRKLSLLSSRLLTIAVIRKLHVHQVNIKTSSMVISIRRYMLSRHLNMLNQGKCGRWRNLSMD
jgi:hypothetical protein